jgi:hypothetical protein
MKSGGDLSAPYEMWISEQPVQLDFFGFYASNTYCPVLSYSLWMNMVPYTQLSPPVMNGTDYSLTIPTDAAATYTFTIKGVAEGLSSDETQ